VGRETRIARSYSRSSPGTDYQIGINMYHTFAFDLTRRELRCGAATLIVIFLGLVNPLPAVAQVLQHCFLLNISEKEMQLAAPNDPAWMKANMWDIGYQRMNDRNMPFLELVNTTAFGGPDIEQFQLTIGDTRFHFEDDVLGTFALLGNTTPGFELTPSTSNGGNLLTVNISKPGGGGLAPGEVVRFKIDIDVDAGLPDPPFFVHPDYRTVLFDMNGLEVYGPDPNLPPGAEDNAQASVTFSGGTMAGPTAFIDEIISGPQSIFFNDSFRPKGVMEPVDIFDVDDCFVIPEPGSSLLVMIGLLSGINYSRRRGRAA
jgi:hypothetical protein